VVLDGPAGWSCGLQTSPSKNSLHLLSCVPEKLREEREKGFGIKSLPTFWTTFKIKQKPKYFIILK
jgi:hypothetical protein